jgi:TonB-linked SusC/RagA family outer membrane protein
MNQMVRWKQVATIARALLGLVAATTLRAQQGSVTGTVKEEGTGTPLAGARVQATEQAGYALTSQGGQYTLRGLGPGAHTLRVLMLGHTSMTQTVTIQAGQTATVDWVLKPAAFPLEEVVVTATGEQLRRELGNAVAKVSAAQVVEEAPILNLTQLLSGRATGVDVLQNSGTSGQSARIRIRGVSSVSLSNDPLLYIDGIWVASDAPAGAFWGGGRVSKLNDLNPDEIESIEIVKGPTAASLYGTQAANGVIRVTTKRGRVGAPQWNAWAEGGILKDPVTYPANYFSKAVSLNPNATCLPYQQALGSCQVQQLYVVDLLNTDSTTPFTTGVRNKVGASVAGGTETMRYYVSGETERETGPIKLPNKEADYLRTERGSQDLPHDQLRPNHVDKHNLRLNLNASPRSNVDLALSSGLVVNNLRLPQLGDNFRGFITAAMTGSPNPAIVPVTDCYAYSPPPNYTGTVTFRKNDHFINSAQINWRPFSWLSSRGAFGLDYLAYADEQNTLNGQGCVTCSTSGIADRQGVRLLNRYTDAKWTVDLNSTAQFKLTDRIGSRTAVGAQYNHDELFGVLATAGVLPPGILSLSAGATKIVNEQTVDVRTLGTYVEQQFSLDERLFVSGALRVDDNSAFGKQARSAKYPKVSASWMALEARDRGLLTSFRLRSAYGVSGLSPGPLDAITYYSPVTASIFGQASTPAVTLGGLGDPTLKPERSAEIEAGFDAGLLSNRVTLELTLYNKRTTDALVQRTQPYSLGGVNQRLENVGIVSNQGIEIGVNARVIDSKSLAWDIQVSASGNKNRLDSLYPGVPPIVGFGYKNIPHYPMFGIWWQNLLSYSDKNNDGFIDPTEVVVTDTLAYLGSSIPVRTVTVNTGVSLFGNRLRIGAQADYKGGFVSLNVNDLFQCSFQINCRAINDPTASLEDQAKAVAGPRAFGGYAENATNIRLREASISYSAPPSVAQMFRARTLSVVLSARNLALWKFGFKSWDPENTTQSTDASNYNFGVQAQPIIATLRVNLGF